LSDRVVAPAAVGGSSGHVTKDLTRFQVSQLEGMEHVKINFFDIWGLEGDNFKEDMLISVLEGKLPEGYTMRQRIKNTAEMIDQSWSIYERRIHCVLVFMPWTVLDSPAIVNALSRNLSICTTSYKVNPLIIVTRSSQAGGEKEQEAVRAKISNRFSVQSGNVYMIDNYTNEQDKNMGLDKKTLDILQRAILSCRTFHTFYKKTLLTDIQSNPPPQQNPQTPQRPQNPQTPQRPQNPQTPQRPQNPQTPQQPQNPQTPSQTPPTSSQQLVCSKCSEPLQSSWDECPVCENPLPRQPSICVCGTPLQPKWKKCPNTACKRPVGVPVRPTHCPTPGCNEELQPNWDECPVCERKI